MTWPIKEPETGTWCSAMLHKLPHVASAFCPAQQSYPEIHTDPSGKSISWGSGPPFHHNSLCKLNIFHCLINQTIHDRYHTVHSHWITSDQSCNWEYYWPCSWVLHQSSYFEHSHIWWSAAKDMAICQMLTLKQSKWYWKLETRAKYSWNSPNIKKIEILQTSGRQSS